MKPIFEDISDDEEDNIIIEEISSDEETPSIILEDIDSDEDYSDIEIETVDYCASDSEDEFFEPAVIQNGAGLDDQQEFLPDHFYELDDPAMVQVRRFNTEGREYSIRFRNLDNLDDLNNRLPAIFQRILEQISTDSEPNALLGVSFMHPDLKNGRILLHFRPRDTLTGDLILNTINSVLQSNQEIRIDDREASICVISVTPPQGSGIHNAHKYILHKDFLKHKRSIIQIKNIGDNLCFARALVVARAHVHKDDAAPLHNWHNIRCNDKGHTLQTQVATELMQQAGLANHHGPCGYNEWPKFQAILPDYQIKIFSRERFKDLLFKGPDAKHALNIYHHDKHYSVITKMPAFFDRSYFCQFCDAAFNNKSDHRCKNVCEICYNSTPCVVQNPRKCADCKRIFKNDHCFSRHKHKYAPRGKDNNKRQKKETSICDRFRYCEICGTLNRQAHLKEHNCGQFECKICKKEVPRKNHMCFMQKDNAESTNEQVIEMDGSFDVQNHDKPEILQRFIFFDFETMQEKVLRQTEQGDILEHEPNLCISHTICDNCRGRDVQECQRCGVRERVFKGEHCLNEFCTYLFGEGMKNVTAIAHNSQGFDGQFIMQFLYKNGHQKFDIVNKGLELMCIKIGSIKIIDSLNFLPMPLAALPNTFGIDELCKGYFPHYFNKKCNANYVGAYPHPDMYGANAMKPSARETFFKWYNEKLDKKKIFDFNAELEAYCRSDVKVLRECCMKFRDIFMQETSVDPFEKSITIASACNLVFRRLFLKPDTIGVIPYNGYSRNERQSIMALKWIKWYSHMHDNLYIRHKLNGGEITIGSYKVDGISGKTVLEFNGCYWHGCPKCMHRRSQLTADFCTKASDAYERTFRRKVELQKRGYEVIEMWECDLLKQLHSSQEMKDFFDSIDIQEPINPRDAFFGGRTNAVKLYHKIKRNQDGTPAEKINYVDVCSLYPFINKYGKYPLGHPKIITEGFQEISKDSHPYEGIVKCIVSPPYALLHPVLPYRFGGKLLFPLCKSCTHMKQKQPCQHNENDRALMGTWVTLELYKAVQKGYKVLKILQVWHYEVTEQYDSNQNPEGGLFSQYVNTFMKMKLESEGYPSRAETDQQKRDYENEVYQRENIILDPSKICKNPGKRALAKLMLNSFWGKFGQRNNMDKTIVLNNPKDYFDLVFDPANIIKCINMINENLISVTYCQHEDFAEVMSNTNPVIAAYTTCQARLKLYSYIERLGSRVLYFDTDSIIYLSRMDKPRQYQVPTGWCLGEMTDELRDFGQGSYITEFASGGPKNYAFRVFSPATNIFHHIVKVRGITLSSSAIKKVNFYSLRRLVFAFVKNDGREELIVQSNRIERQKDRKVITRKAIKKFRIVYDKRILRRNFCTYPFGWRK